MLDYLREEIHPAIKTTEVIDCRPTWKHTLPELIDLLKSKKKGIRESALEELKRMAHGADLWNKRKRVYKEQRPQVLIHMEDGHIAEVYSNVFLSWRQIEFDNQADLYEDGYQPKAGDIEEAVGGYTCLHLEDVESCCELFRGEE